MIKVQTTEGRILHKTVPGEKKNLTKEEAEALAKSANEQAEELGIKTRYEVVE